MAEFPNAVLNPSSGEVILNMKQMIEDRAIDAKRRDSNASTFDKAMDSLTIDGRQDAMTIKHMGQLATLIAMLSAETSNETADATEDTAQEGVATSNEAVAASIGNLATASVALITATGGVVTAQSLAAILPILVNAIGGASTPSQTQAKPTS